MLSRHPDAPVTVFVVWEPILITDWSAPGPSALNRLTDPRVTQFWDPNHLVALRLAADARPPQPEPACCNRRGFLWDLAAVYPRQAVWDERLPSATLFNGPVVDYESPIQDLITTH